MTRKQFKDLRKAQQGELDAVLMYNALADTVSDPADAETFRKLAAEEGRHGSVFRAYTEQIVKPRRTKAVLLPFLYRALGRKITYRLIARGEYDAARAYEHLIPAFPEVESIRADEQRHGGGNHPPCPARGMDADLRGNRQSRGLHLAPGPYGAGGGGALPGGLRVYCGL